MPIKVDIQMNIDDVDLTVESCSEMIAMLQSTYKNIRQDIYSHFLGFKNLCKALLFAGFCLFFYFATEDLFFVFLMPISVIITLVFSIMSAEYLTKQTKKLIQEKIVHYIEKKEILLKKEKIKV